MERSLGPVGDAVVVVVGVAGIAAGVAVGVAWSPFETAAQLSTASSAPSLSSSASQASPARSPSLSCCPGFAHAAVVRRVRAAVVVVVAHRRRRRCASPSLFAWSALRAPAVVSRVSNAVVVVVGIAGVPVVVAVGVFLLGFATRGQLSPASSTVSLSSSSSQTSPRTSPSRSAWSGLEVPAQLSWLSSAIAVGVGIRLDLGLKQEGESVERRGPSRGRAVTQHGSPEVRRFRLRSPEKRSRPSPAGMSSPIPSPAEMGRRSSKVRRRDLQGRRIRQHMWRARPSTRGRGGQAGRISEGAPGRSCRSTSRSTRTTTPGFGAVQPPAAMPDSGPFVAQGWPGLRG